MSLAVSLLPLTSRAEYITQQDVAFTWLWILGIGLVLGFIYVLPVLNLIFIYFYFREIAQLPSPFFTSARKQRMIAILSLLYIVAALVLFLLHRFTSIDVWWGCFFALWVQGLFFIFLRLWKRTKNVSSYDSRRN